MTDLWLRTTKDIEKGVISYNPVGTENVLVTSDGNPSGTTTTATTPNGQQKVIMGNQNQNQNQQPENMPLVGEEPANNQQRRQPVRALPPPSADGSLVQAPEEEEQSDDGEIDLDF